jgi:hypothetical protein
MTIQATVRRLLGWRLPSTAVRRLLRPTIEVEAVLHSTLSQGTAAPSTLLEWRLKSGDSTQLLERRLSLPPTGVETLHSASAYCLPVSVCW